MKWLGYVAGLTRLVAMHVIVAVAHAPVELF